MSDLDQKVRYTIQVQGDVGDALADCFGPLRIARRHGANGQVITTIAGEVLDQAALVGLVRHLHGLGIVLISVERNLAGAWHEEGL